MIEGWSTADEQRSAFLVHTEAGDDEPDMRFLVMIEEKRGESFSHEIIGAFPDRTAAAELLTKQGFKYVNPETIAFLD